MAGLLSSHAVLRLAAVGVDVKVVDAPVACVAVACGDGGEAQGHPPHAGRGAAALGVDRQVVAGVPLSLLPAVRLPTGWNTGLSLSG